MEIVITHTIHPDVIALLAKFMSPNVGGQQLAQKEVAAAPAEVKAAKALKPAKEVKEAEASKETAPVAEVKKIEFTDIRQLYLQKKDAGKQELVKKILDEYGVEKLSAIKPDQFEEVYNKMNVL